MTVAQMDLKPQRSFARVFADENAAPAAFPPKTLHVRHHSQPKLDAFVNDNGLIKPTARRAFGDVSNVAVNKILGQDNSSQAKPGAALGKTSSTLILASKPPTRPTESRLPQKPLLRTAASSFALGNGSAVLKSTSTQLSQAPSVLAQPPKALRKARTTVFNEKSRSRTRSATVQQDLAAPEEIVKVPQQFPLPGPPKPSETISAAEPSLPNEEEPASLPEVELANLEEIVAQATEAPQEATELPQQDSAFISTDAVLQEASTTDRQLQEEDYLAEVDVCGPALSVIVGQGFLEEACVDSAEKPACAPVLPALAEVLPVHGPISATIPEPEEYWDVEEDEPYLEEGYVTARSFKSIGENQLSGNVTRTLYPVMDQAVKREIAAAKALIESTLDPAEVEDEAWDTSMVQEYGDEIFEYMRELEVRMSPNPHYMDKQTEIQWSMRSVLMDWIVQVHHRFGLLPETLFLCINLVDRFLSQKIVSLTKLQLVGATAIFVAAKYEEVDCPSVQEINFMVDNGYGIDEILKAERFMLSMLGFELGYPGPMSFLRRISKADDYDLETRTLAKYFLEVTLMDERFLTCVPSFTAAGAHCLARLMLHKGNWSPGHIYYSNYTYSQLHPLISLMLECCEDPLHHHNAVYEKYLDRRYKQAAKYVQTELGAGFRIPDENVNVASKYCSPVQPQFPIDVHQYHGYWPQIV